LVMVPALLSHATLDPEVRRRMGVTDGLVRMAVGLEATADLIADIDQALDGLSDAATLADCAQLAG